MIPRWPFRRAAPAFPPAVPVAAEAPAWSLLPPLQRVLTPVETIAPRERLTAALSSWRDPRFLAPLGHLLHDEAPGGRVDGLVTPTAGRAVPGPAPELPRFRPPGGRRTLQRSTRRDSVPIFSAQRALVAGAPGPPEPTAPAAPPEKAPEVTPAPRLLVAVEGLAAPTVAPTVAPAIDHPAAFRPAVASAAEPAVAQLMATAGREPASAETTVGTPAETSVQTSVETSAETSPTEQAVTDAGRTAEPARPLVGVLGGDQREGSPDPGEAFFPPAMRRRGEGSAGGPTPPAPTVSLAGPTPHVGPALLHDAPAGPPAVPAEPTGPSRPVGAPAWWSETVRSPGSGDVQRRVAEPSREPPRGLSSPESGTVPSSVVMGPVDGRAEMRAMPGATEIPDLTAGAGAPEPESAGAVAPEPAAVEVPVVSRSVVPPSEVHVPPVPPDRSAGEQPAGSPPAPEVQLAPEVPRALVSDDAPLAGGTAIGPAPEAPEQAAPEMHGRVPGGVRGRAVDARAVPSVARTGTEVHGGHASVAGGEPADARSLLASSPTVSPIRADLPADAVPAHRAWTTPRETPMVARATDARPPESGLLQEAASWDPGASFAPSSRGTVPPAAQAMTPGDSPLPGASAPRPRRPGLGEPLSGPLDLQRIAVPADAVPPSPPLSGAPSPAFERGPDHTVLTIPPLPDGPLGSQADEDLDTGMPSASRPGPAPAAAPVLNGPAGTVDRLPAIGEGLPPIPVVARIVPLLGTGPSVAGPSAVPGEPGRVRPADVGGTGSPAAWDGPPPTAATRHGAAPGPVGGAGAASASGGAAGLPTVARETAKSAGAGAGGSMPPPAAVQQIGHEVVQRVDLPAPDPVAAPPDVTALPASVTALPESAAAPSAGPATGAAGPTGAPSGAALDELVRRLYDPLSARLKDELRLDRERAGLITDLRH